MAVVSVLTEHDLRRAVGMGTAELEAIEAVFPLISAGAGSMPSIMRIDVPERNGEVDIKSAYLPGFPGIAVKISAGFFDNPKLGLPSLGGLMILLDARTGTPQAALFDNGYLTDLRTGLAGAVAAEHLSNADASSVAVFGAGVQARMQLEALRLVRPIDSVTIWARRPVQAERLAQETAGWLGDSVEVADTRHEAAARADILVSATPATEPLVDVRMLHPGLHITAVGADAEHKQELAADLIDAVDVFAVDSWAQSRRLGELRSAEAAGHDIDRAVELGRLIAGEATGRTSHDDITVCDLTGTGAQDTAIAGLAVQRCIDAALGTTVAT